MVAQSDETEPKCASSLAVGIAVPVKVVVVDDRPVEDWTIGDRDYDDGSRLDQCPGHDCRAREDPATSHRADADLYAVVGDRPQEADPRRGGYPRSRIQTCSRGRSATPADAELTAAPGGGTCAGGVVSASSSSFIPALKALMPLAKSPITRGSFPAPNRIRIMARTTIQCIKLNEPIMTTPDY